MFVQSFRIMCPSRDYVGKELWTPTRVFVPSSSSSQPAMGIVWRAERVLLLLSLSCRCTIVNTRTTLMIVAQLRMLFALVACTFLA